LVDTESLSTAKILAEKVEAQAADQWPNGKWPKAIF
jgi:hypothetical protein